MAGSTCVQSARAAFEQQADLLAVQRHHLGLLEQLAVEARQRGAQDDGEAAGVHLAPQRGEQRHELLRGVLQGLEQVVKAPRPRMLPGQQADIFGEHREQAAGEEAGDEFGVMAGASSVRAMRPDGGDRARDARRGARRVERQRVAPQACRRSRMPGSARSASLMRCERGSGKGV
jgi:hypothetical protein